MKQVYNDILVVKVAFGWIILWGSCVIGFHIVSWISSYYKKKHGIYLYKSTHISLEIQCSSSLVRGLAGIYIHCSCWYML